LKKIVKNKKQKKTTSKIYRIILFELESDYINGPTRQYAVIHKNIKNIPKYLKNNNLLSQLVPCKPGGQPH
jgi:hypothetical protein